MNLSVKTGICVGDLHFCYQDDKAIEPVIRLARDMQPDFFVINGDLLDMKDVASFDANPLKAIQIKTEFEAASDFLRQVSEYLPNTEKHYIFGNHEYRLDKYIWRYAKKLAGLSGLTIAEQLGTEKYGWKVHYSETNESYMDMGSFLIGHFNKVSIHSAYTAKGLFDRYGRSLIQNHVHRGGEYYRTIGGQVYKAVEGFCLCDLNPEYMLFPNWQQGFVIFRIDEDGWFDIEPVPMINYRCRYF